MKVKEFDNKNKSKNDYWETIQAGCPSCRRKLYFNANGCLFCNNWKCDSYKKRGVRFKWNSVENRLMRGRVDFIEDKQEVQ